MKLNATGKTPVRLCHIEVNLKVRNLILNMMASMILMRKHDVEENSSAAKFVSATVLYLKCNLN